MKVTLEFEDVDLKEMLTNYFRGNGFAVKNLDEVCALFHGAYPEGLKVQAEIIAIESPPSPPPARTMSAEEKAIYEPIDPMDEFDRKDDDVAEESDSPTLSLNDLTDPEPRGRVVSITNTKNEFADLLNASKRIETERRRS